MCFGGYIPAGAEVIGSLKKGDKILLAPKHGNPASDVERTLIVAEVSVFSAMCADGTQLACQDGSAVMVLSHDNPFELSEAAKKVLNHVGVSSLDVGDVIKVAAKAGWPTGTQDRVMIVVDTNPDVTTALAVDREYLAGQGEVPLTSETFAVLTCMDGMRVTQTDEVDWDWELPKELLEALDEQGIPTISF